MKNMMFLKQGCPDGMDTVFSLLVSGRGKSLKWWPLQVRRVARFGGYVQLRQYVQLRGFRVNRGKV